MRSTNTSVSALRPRRSIRASQVALIAGAAVSLMCAVQHASAQTSTWAPNGSGNWSVPGNWDTVPVPGTTTALVFNSQLLSGAYTATNDIGAFAGILRIDLNNEGSSNIIVAGGSNVLTFDPAGAVINQLGPRAATVSHALALSGGNLTLQGGGDGDLALSGIISGTGNIIINRSSAAGTTQLSGANTFTGNVILNSGTFDIMGNAASGDTLGNAANTLIINGGELRNSTFGGTFSHNIVLNSDMLLRGSNGEVFGGVISGAGGIKIRQGFPGNSVSFTAANTFQGAVTLETIGNTPNNAILSGANGAWTQTSGIELFSDQALTLNNSGTVNGDRINDAATLSMHRATLQVQGGTTSFKETIGATTMDGFNMIALLPNTAAATQIRLASLTPVNGGTLQFFGNNMGQNTIASQTANNANIEVAAGVSGAVGGGGAAGSTNISILPWAVGNNTASTALNFPAFGVYDAANGLRPLTAAEQNTSSLALFNPAADQNMRELGTVAGINSNRSVNSLLLDSPNGAAVGTGLYGPGTVKVNSGGVIIGLSGGTTAPTFAAVIASGLDFGTAKGYIHTPASTFTTAFTTTLPSGSVASANIVGTISGSGGVVKSGLGTLTLAGNNTFTGGFTINGGPVVFTQDSALGAAGQPINMNSGLQATTLLGLTYGPSSIWGRLGDLSVNVNRPINLGPAGGILGASFVNDTANYSGQISGPGHLFVLSNGVTALSPGNTYSGGTSLMGGVASITSGSALGTGVINMFGGVLRTDGANPVTINTDIVSSAQTIFQTNVDTTLNGGLSVSPWVGTTTAFTWFKHGQGTLHITGKSSYGEPNGIGAGIQLGLTGNFFGDQPTALTGGAISLEGANGNLAGATGVNMTANSTLILDNSAANNNNRISNGTIGFFGGYLKLIGNASVATSEFTGGLNINPSATNSGYNAITVQPNAATSSQLTFQSYTTPAVASSALMLVRGANLGSTPGAGVANVFIGNNPGVLSNAVYGTAPTTVAVAGGSTILPRFITDTTNTGNGTGFATYAAATGITPFSAYQALNLSGVPATPVVADVTSAQALTGAASNAAIRIGTGGSINTAGNILTIGATGIPGTILTTDTATITGGGSLAFGATQGFVVNNAALGITSQITGTAGLSKAGTGTLTLNTSPTLTGTYTVDQGTLLFGAGVTLPAAASSIAAVGATIDLGGNNLTQASIAGFGTYALGTNSLTVSGTAAVAFPGSLTGSGDLVLGSPSTSVAFALQGNSPSYSGAVRVGNTTSGIATLTLQASQGAGTGTIFLGNAATGATLSVGSNLLSFANNINVVAGTGVVTIAPVVTANQHLTGTVTLNRQLALSTSSGFSFDGVIQNGTTTPTGSGILWSGGSFNFNAANTYSSGTIFNAASAANWVGVGSDSIGSTSGAFGTGSVTIQSSFGIRADGGARTVSNSILNTATAAYTLRFAGLNPLTFSGPASLSSIAAATPTIETDSPAPLTFSGAVTSLATAALVKNGGGTLVFSGGGTLAGPITANAGITRVNGASALTVGGAGVTVNANAIFGGNGTVLGAVTVASGGILDPGNSPGIFTISGNTLLNSGAFYNIELNGPNAGNGPTNYDRTVVNGTVSLDQSNLLGQINYVPGSTLTDIYWIIVNDLVDPVTGTFAGLPEGAVVQLGLVGSVAYSANISYNANFDTGMNDHSGNDVLLYNIVPAPSTTALLGLGGLLAARRRRR